MKTNECVLYKNCYVSDDTQKTRRGCQICLIEKSSK